RRSAAARWREQTVTRFRVAPGLDAAILLPVQKVAGFLAGLALLSKPARRSADQIAGFRIVLRVLRGLFPYGLKYSCVFLTDGKNSHTLRKWPRSPATWCLRSDATSPGRWSSWPDRGRSARPPSPGACPEGGPDT